jgi:ribosomal protein S18 acetylase RimI-like enzyme
VIGLSVKRAGLEDLDRLVPLFEAYRAFYGQQPDPEGARQFLEDRLRNEESVVFLATGAPADPEAAVGFVQLYPLFTSSGMLRVWLLNDLFVAPPHRRSGAARQLMEEAQELAAATGASQLRLATAKDNAAAKALYHSLGYRLDTTFDHYSLAVADVTTAVP